MNMQQPIPEQETKLGLPIIDDALRERVLNVDSQNPTQHDDMVAIVNIIDTWRANDIPLTEICERLEFPAWKYHWYRKSLGQAPGEPNRSTTTANEEEMAELFANIQELRDQGVPIIEACKQLRTTTETYYRYGRALGILPPPQKRKPKAKKPKGASPPQIPKSNRRTPDQMREVVDAVEAVMAQEGIGIDPAAAKLGIGPTTYRKYRGILAAETPERAEEPTTSKRGRRKKLPAAGSLIKAAVNEECNRFINALDAAYDEVINEVVEKLHKRFG